MSTWWPVLPAAAVHQLSGLGASRPGLRGNVFLCLYSKGKASLWGRGSASEPSWLRSLTLAGSARPQIVS